jgi:DNA primase
MYLSYRPTNLGPFIYQQLIEHGVKVMADSPAKTQLQAYCFKGHDHDSASLFIRKRDGAFKCFGCGVKGRNWNELAKHLNAKMLTDDELPDPIKLFHENIKDRKRNGARKATLPWDLEPWNAAWRGISSYTMSAADAFRWYDDRMECYRMLFPIYKLTGPLWGWVARRMDKQQKMKYRNSTGLPSEKILYPLHIVRQMKAKSVALVEGPVDALKLIDRDIPALSIMGTKNYHRSNRIILLNLGIERVVVATDGDTAGDDCREKITPSLEKLFEVDHYACPRKKDPGALPKKEYRKLWKLVNRG